MEKIPTALPDPLPFASAASVTFVGSDSVALIDASSQQIVVMPLQKGEERRFGGEGEGPGEYRLAHLVAYSTGVGFLVSDSKLRRISIIDRSGDFVRQSYGSALLARPFSWDETLVVGLWQSPRDGASVIGSLDLRSGLMEDSYSLLERIPEIAREIPFGQPAFIGGDRFVDGRTVVGWGHSYRLFVLDSLGQVSLFAHRPRVPPEFRSEVEIDEFLMDLERMERMTGVPFSEAAREEVLRDLIEAPKPYFTSGSIRTDPEGRLWVPTQRWLGGGTSIDVFTSEGKFLLTVQVDGKVKDLAFLGDTLMVLGERRSGPSNGLDGIDLYALPVLKESQD